MRVINFCHGKKEGLISLVALHSPRNSIMNICSSKEKRLWRIDRMIKAKPLERIS